jgi:hypothetical protein
MKTLSLLFCLVALGACSKKAETCKQCTTVELWTGTPVIHKDVDAGVLCGDDLERFEAVKPISGGGHQKYNRCKN